MVGTLEEIQEQINKLGLPPEQLYEIKKHREKKSDASRRYFHRLVGLLAKGETMKFYQKKNELITQYGNRVLLRDKDGKLKYTILPDDDSWKYDEVYHYLPTDYTDEFRGKKMRAFCMWQGTADYNSKDMANLIEGARGECLGSGIPWEEIETPNERKIMQGLMNEYEKHNSDG